MNRTCSEAAECERTDGPVLDLAKAQHFANRFGFGCSKSELRELAGRRAGEVFDEWLGQGSAPERLDLYVVRWEDYGSTQDGAKIPSKILDVLDRDAAKEQRRQWRLIDKGQYRSYIDDWINGIRTHRDPLRDRMALFWHGFFPTSVKVVRRRYECIHQHTMFRQRALGSFVDLLSGIVRDPAMLGYFDNDTSSKEHPNENFARELLELYSLGEGNYSEHDVREVARALTGYQGESGSFVLDESLHDSGEKQILGRTGHFSGDDLPGILAGQPACARYVCTKLLTSFEGCAPDDERLAEYSKALRDAGYDISILLRKLCTDVRFYRSEVLGTRVQGPIEWLIGTARRVGLQPPANFIYYAAAALGQQLYAPPTVNGWDEGEAWISHSSLLLRGKCIGLMLKLGTEEVLEDITASTNPELKTLMRELRAFEVRRTNIRARVTEEIGAEADDERIAAWATDEWLGRPALAGTHALAAGYLAEHRRVEGAKDPILRHPSGEDLLAKLAHKLLSLPVAQLN